MRERFQFGTVGEKREMRKRCHTLNIVALLAAMGYTTDPILPWRCRHSAPCSQR